MRMQFNESESIVYRVYGSLANTIVEGKVVSFHSVNPWQASDEWEHFIRMLVDAGERRSRGNFHYDGSNDEH